MSFPEFFEVEDARIEPDEVPAAPRRRGRVIGTVAVAVALTAAIGAFGVAAAHKSVAVEADGNLTQAGTFTGTVAELLSEQGVEIGEHDEVIPSLDTELSDGLSVEVLRAQAIDVLSDGAAGILWTTQEHVGAALAEDAERREVALAVSRSADRAEIDLPLVGAVTIVSMDGDVDVTLTGPTTLQQLLDRQGLELNAADEVSVVANADATTRVTIVRVATTKVTESETVKHGATKVESNAEYEGSSSITTKGVDGRIDRVYEVTTRDGVEVAKELVSETTAVKKVDQVTTVGTKKRPAPKAEAASTSTASVTGVWAKLAQCESGGNPTIVSSNGRYHGLYQFTVSTWRSVGGSGLPSQASAAEQTKRAQILQQRSGWGQWPACSSRLGLR